MMPYNYRKVPDRRISQKWYPAIWAVLVAASLFRNMTGIVADVSASLPDGVASVAISVIFDIILSGVLPAALCYLCGLVLFTMSARRGYMYCHRDDFIYWVMIFTAGARLVIGVAECFAFLNPVVSIYTAFTADVLVLTGAMFALFFAVLRRYMNDRTASDLFNLYGGVYFIVQGLLTVVPCSMYLAVFGDSARSEQLREILNSIGYNISVVESVHYESACIAGMCIFGAWLVAYVVLAVLLREKAKKYVPPAAPSDGGNPFGGNGGNDNGGNGNGGNGNGGNPFDDGAGGNPFGGDSAPSDGGDGKVFEEFDL